MEESIWICFPQDTDSTDIRVAVRPEFLSLPEPVFPKLDRIAELLGNMEVNRFPSVHCDFDLVRGNPLDGDWTCIIEHQDCRTLAGGKSLKLSLGIIDGRNIWKTDLTQAVSNLRSALKQRPSSPLIIATSCSLLHSPLDLGDETDLDPELKSWLSFAKQKLGELKTLREALTDYGIGRVDMETRVMRPVFLVFTDGYFPGWECMVLNHEEGRETRIFPADLAFRAVFLPEGRHRLRWTYKPDSTSPPSKAGPAEQAQPTNQSLFPTTISPFVPTSIIMDISDFSYMRVARMSAVSPSISSSLSPVSVYLENEKL